MTSTSYIDMESPKPQANDILVQKYYELIYAVAKKYPGETRHDTALRYIREAENRTTHGPCKVNPT